MRLTALWGGVSLTQPYDFLDGNHAVIIGGEFGGRF
jgi:hypothetical protein